MKDFAGPAVAPPPPKEPTKKIPSPSSAPQAASPKVTSQPLPGTWQMLRDEMEKEIQAEMEKEFAARFDAIKAESEKQVKQELIKNETARKKNEENLALEKKRFEQWEAQIKQKSEEMIASMRKSMEQDKEMTEKYQAKIKKLEDSLQAKELEIYAKKNIDALLEQETQPVLPPRLETKSPAPPVPPRAKEPEANQSRPWMEPKIEPPPAAGIKPPSVFSTAERPSFDSAVQSKAKSIYDRLSRGLTQIFEQVTKSEALNLSSVLPVLGELVSLAQQSEAELIAVVLEPYPAGADYFVYHSVHCAVLSTVVGLDFEFGSEELQDLAAAALFHDIGLVQLRDRLDYPKQLTPDIQKDVLAHPEKGAEMLKGLLNETICLALGQHHEAANGKGYPRGLEGKDIHPYARILHIVDSFEALIHERPYRQKPFEVNQAMKELIEAGRGIYDGGTLKALMGRVGLYPVMSLVELSNKQIARVIRQNKKFPLSPVVKVEFDEWGGKAKTPPVIDLTQHQLVHIIGPIRDVPSFGRPRVEAPQAAKESAPPKETSRIRDFIPVILIILVIGLLLLVVIKI